jgi:hypothetical protein
MDIHSRSATASAPWTFEHPRFDQALKSRAYPLMKNTTRGDLGQNLAPFAPTGVVHQHLKLQPKRLFMNRPCFADIQVTKIIVPQNDCLI